MTLSFPLLEKYVRKEWLFIIFNLQWFSVKEEGNLFLLVLGDECAQM